MTRPGRDGALLRALKAAIEEELRFLPEIEALLGEALAALEAASEEHAIVPAIAVASLIADVYLLVENVLKRVARAFEGIPTGSEWHKELLDAATLDIPTVRRPVLRKETRDRLDALRAFRHVVRNVYGARVRPARALELAACVPPTVSAFREDMAAFLGFLDALAGLADAP